MPTASTANRRPLALVAGGVAIAVVILFVALNLDQDEDPVAANPSPAMPEITDLLPPTLTAEDFVPGAGDTDLSLDVPLGGWIQIAGDDGRLAQQYRFDKLDPNPEGHGPGWIQMQEPEFEVYFTDGRLVRLTGATSTAYAPSRAVERGSITGDVVIRLYEVPPGVDRNRADPNVDPPSLIVRTVEASFDNVLGQVRRDERIVLETSSSVFDGRGLSILIDDQEDVVRHLEIRSVNAIRLAAAPAPNAADPPTDADPPAAVPPAAPARTAAAPRAQAPPPAKADAPGSTETFYRLILHDNVRIRQGAEDAGRTAAGDRLTLVFTLESEGIATKVGQAERVPVPLNGPLPRHLALLGAVLAAPADEAIAPAPHPDDVIITCTGPLTVKPLADPADFLPSPKDARLVLEGAPVRLDDVESNTHAEGTRLIYDARPDELALVHAADELVVVTSPRLEAEVERFWLRRTARTGGFNGAGRAELFDVPADHRGPRPDDVDRLDLMWADGVDLTLAEDAGDENGIGGLETITFRGGVHVEGRSVSLDDGAQNGRLEAESLRLEFDGTQVRRLHAATSVHVRDVEQELWCNALDVLFRTDTDTDTVTDTGTDTGTDTDTVAARIASAVARDDVFLRRADGTLVFADALTVSGVERTAALVGENLALVDGDTLLDRCREIRGDEVRATYEVTGPGRLRRRSTPPVLPRQARLTRDAIDVLWALDELRFDISWTRGVEVYPLRPGDDAQVTDDTPRIARCRGTVKAHTPDLRLDHADEVTIRFRDADGTTAIDELTALGAVAARSADDPGAIRCERLVVTMGPNPDGGTQPRSAEATGGVLLTDGSQHIWATRLDVTFRPAPLDAKAAVELDRAVAVGPVQARLADGQRVFADALVVTEGGASATLDGNPLLIVGDTFAVENATLLVLERDAGRYAMPCAGNFSTFAEPITLDPELRPIEVPVLPANRSLTARWTDRALFRENETNLGRLELIGNVHAESRPNPREESTVDAGRLELEIAAARGPDAPAEDETSDGERRIRWMRARDAARIESRAWADDARTGLPRVFYVSGDDVEFDQYSFLGHVHGPGQVVIQAGAETDGTPPATGFARGGATIMRWTDSLAMRGLGERTLALALKGGVECIHEAVDGRISTLTGNALEARLRRERPWRYGTNDEVAVSSRVDLERLDGTGSIFVRTPDRDINCDHFAYDLGAGRAELSADPGRLVTVLDQAGAEPIRHERLVWDMQRDTITIERGGGAGIP